MGKLLVMLLVALPLTGCSALHITEQGLNQELATRLEQGVGENRIQLTMPDGAFDMALLVKEANIDLTERDGGLVLLAMDTDIQGTLTMFGRDVSFKTSLKPAFESGIRLQANEVYLVAPKLTNIQVHGSDFSDAMLRQYLGGLHSEFEQAVAQYFERHPVYVLDHSLMERTAASFVKNLAITEDTIEFLIF